jgi:hypothetical protein
MFKKSPKSAMWQIFNTIFLKCIQGRFYDRNRGVHVANGVFVVGNEGNEHMRETFSPMGKRIVESKLAIHSGEVDWRENTYEHRTLGDIGLRSFPPETHTYDIESTETIDEHYKEHKCRIRLILHCDLPLAEMKAVWINRGWHWSSRICFNPSSSCESDKIAIWVRFYSIP